jgi:alcohol dehydrogenase class IV
MTPSAGLFDEKCRIARILTGNPDAQPEDGAEWIQALTGRLSIPSLASYGIGDAARPQIVEKAARANSMKANPVPLTAGELTSVIEMSL